MANNVLKFNIYGLVDALSKEGPSLSENSQVEALLEIQHYHDKLEAQYIEEKRALDAKYQKLYQPLYAKRYEIVNGAAKAEGSSSQSVNRGVPNFWLLALKNNEVIYDEVTIRDEEALKYLKDIKWCKLEEPKGFKLEFYFDTNPYFKNIVLTKTYHMVDEEEPMLKRAIGTEIEWYPGKSLMQQLPKERSKDAEPITKTKECGSFFGFFDPTQPPKYGEFISSDDAKVVQFQMEEDYDIGAVIREKIIPHAVSWFIKKDIEDDSDEDDSYNMDDEDEDEDEDEDNDNYDMDDEDEDEDEDNDNEAVMDGSKTKI